jgi:hypothetical protein
MSHALDYAAWPISLPRKLAPPTERHAVLKVGAVIIAVIVVVVLFSRRFSPSAREMLDWQLDDLAETESRRLSSESGEPVRVTVSLDLIEKRDDPRHPLLAVVHLKRDGKEYSRPWFLYNSYTLEWASHPESNSLPTPVTE